MFVKKYKNMTIYKRNKKEGIKMKDKSVAIYQLFVAIPITIFLIIFFYHGDFTARLLLTPFIVCAIATLFKSIFTLKGNLKWSRYCNSVYIISILVYVLGFFVASWYIAIKNQIYALMIVLLIVSVIIILAIRHRFFKKRQSKEEMARGNERFLKRERLKRKVGRLTKPIVFSLILVLGVVLLCLGILNWLDVKEETKDYKEVTGHFMNVDIYRQDEDGTSYSLTYYYIVNGEKYQITTSYGTGMVPKKDSTRTIIYNPDNPEEARIVGGESFVILLLVGLMFTVIPALFLIETLRKKTKDKKPSRFSFFAFGMGVFLFTLCYGILYMMTGTFSFVQMFQMYGIGLLVSAFVLIILMLVGVYFMVMSVYQAITYKEKNKDTEL